MSTLKEAKLPSLKDKIEAEKVEPKVAKKKVAKKEVKKVVKNKKK